jgi:hypothetical protein
VSRGRGAPLLFIAAATIQLAAAIFMLLGRSVPDRRLLQSV